jgi:UDP-glucose 4-epimerase
MKIMITGGAGFIGSHLCDLLLKNRHQIIVLSRNKKNENIAHLKNKIKVENVDITNFLKLGKILQKYKPDVIIHLAGETSHSRSFENPLYDVDVNSKSTLFMLEKIRQLNFKCKFILGSTFIVVGRPTKLPVNENTPCFPTTVYGINRLSSEYFCEIYHRLYGLDTVTFRITNSFGPREQIIPKKNAINFLISQSFKGEKITIYDHGKFFRDLIYVSDVVSAISILIKKGKSGNLYWISSGKKTWFYQFGKYLEDLTKTKVKYVPSPNYTKKVDVGNFVVDNTKLKSLGWKPSTTIKQGIKETLNYLKMKN